MPSHELKQVIESADNAINREDFDTLMEFYSEDATLVVRPGLNATGKQQIRNAFVAISEYFNHSLVVKQGDMVVIEGGNTALVLAQTLLSGMQNACEAFAMERHATYVFKRDSDDVWRCVVDNSYGTELIRPESAPVLYLVCGKIGAGKTTLAQQLAAAPKTILVSEDDWLSQLYPDEINNLADYVRCTGRFRKVLAGHIEALLRAGLSVVLDLPANTPASRQWAKTIFENSAVAHELHYLDVPNETCRARLRERNATGSHPFMASDDEFDEITRYFVPPSPDEGFNVIRHT